MARLGIFGRKRATALDFRECSVFCSWQLGIMGLGEDQAPADGFLLAAFLAATGGVAFLVAAAFLLGAAFLAGAAVFLVPGFGAVAGVAMAGLGPVLVEASQVWSGIQSSLPWLRMWSISRRMPRFSKARISVGSKGPNSTKARDR